MFSHISTGGQKIPNRNQEVVTFLHRGGTSEEP